MIKKIKENFYYIGVLDRELKVFDVIMETKYGTSYNSYLIQTENHNILIETVKVHYFDEYLKNINELVGIENIDTIIVNHTEPDHVGSIEKLLSLNPNIKIIGSKAAILYLSNITNKAFNHEALKPNQEIQFDDKTFKFLSVPFLHWPDSIYTYIKEDGIIFTCDSFGAHYAYEDILLSKMEVDKYEDYIDAYRYYYDAIFAPYKSFLLQAIDKIKDLEINMICTGHGPVIDKNIQDYIETYKKWSTDEKTYDKLIVIPYATSYGYTEMMAELIEKGIKAYDDSIEVHRYNINVVNYKDLERKIVSEIYEADAVLFGSTTINKDATPVIWDLAINLNAVIHKGKYGAAFGSYGWSGEGVDHISHRIKTASLKALPQAKLKFKPSKENEEMLIQYGKELAGAIYHNQEVTLYSGSKLTIKEV